MWNARGDQGHLSDGTSSGLEKLTRKREVNSITDERRFVKEPQCSQLLCKPKTLTYHLKNFEDAKTIHGVICRGI